MALPIAHAPHSGPVDQPGEGAYRWARSGIARSATTRSNYVFPLTSIDWIVRDAAGTVISTTDLSGVILVDSLRVTQAINDEPDTCSFTLRPQRPAAAGPASSPYADQVLADGASHYWRLGDTSGTTAGDAKGTAPGTIVGGVTLNQAGALAEANPAMGFNGTSGKITVPTSAPLATSGTWTAEVWMRTTALTAGSPRYFLSTRNGNTSGSDGTVIAIGVNFSEFFIEVIGSFGTGGSGTTGGPVLSDGLWHHVVFVWEGLALRVYIDGAQRTLTLAGGFAWTPSATHTFEIGFDAHIGTYWDGGLDEIAVYPLALSPAQIVNHYALRTSTGGSGSETPVLIPQVGQEIRVAWAPGGPPLFHGYIVTAQSDWRLLNVQPPWMAYQCQDAMWRFDARIVTYRFPAQSVTDSIAFLVKWFCNNDPSVSSPLDFTLGAVQPGMPSLPAIDVVNQRPSTVMRTLMASVNGGFYIEGLTVHAWANSVSEPNHTNPQPLTVGLKTLHAFRRTEDATQLRRRVLVEGKRSATLVSYPALATALSVALGVPLEDGSPFQDNGIVRIGSQWMGINNLVSVRANGANPPQTHIQAAFDPAGASASVYLDPMPVVPPAYGWVRVGNQYARYGSYTGNPLTGVWSINIAGPGYGRFTVPIPVGETVEWIDGAANMASHGVNWRTPIQDDTRSEVVSSPVVLVAMAQAPPSTWPELEGFVQDGRYSYAGAQARADADLAQFQQPLVSLEWETDDLNALPGRSQVIALSSAAVTPAINMTVTILRVELRFPLRTLPPRRSCSGGVVKPSTFMDLVVTENN